MIRAPAHMRAARDETIRYCRLEDLDALEWDGEFAHDRAIIDWAYSRMRADAMAMLVADHAGEIVGQVWLDFARDGDAAHVWALRVKRPWRRGGIASRLLRATEVIAAARGWAMIELEVEPSNTAAVRLYRQLGYYLWRCEPGQFVLRRELGAVDDAPLEP